MPVQVAAGQTHETVHLIDWEHPEKNDFALAEEVTLKGGYQPRPDLVLYINGIAIGVFLKGREMSEAKSKFQCLLFRSAKVISFFLIAVSCQFSQGYGKEKLIAVTLEYPPYNYTDKKTNSVVGATPELMRAISKEMGYELDIRSLPWKRSQMLLATGKAQIIFTYTRSHERQKVAYYSNPISTLRTIFVKNRHSKVPSKWEKLSDLKEYRIGINGGYNYPPVFMQALEKKLLPKVDPISSQNPTIQNLRKLLINRIDYVICPPDCLAEINKLPKKDRESIEKIDKTIGSERTFHVGFAKNYPGWKSAAVVRQKFNKLLDQYLQQGKVKAIYEKYNIDANYEILGSKLKIDWDRTLD